MKAVSRPPVRRVPLPSSGRGNRESYPLMGYPGLIWFLGACSFCRNLMKSYTMRLPRALNPNENPAQFGIFFSANRLNMAPKITKVGAFAFTGQNCR